MASDQRWINCIEIDDRDEEQVVHEGAHANGAEYNEQGLPSLAVFGYEDLTEDNTFDEIPAPFLTHTDTNPRGQTYHEQRPHRELTKAIDTYGTTYRVGDAATIRSDDRHEKFLLIRRIFYDAGTHDTLLRGWILRRTKYLRMLEPMLNDVYIHAQADRDDTRHWTDQAQVDVSIKDVSQRRCCRLSFKAHPIDSWRERVMFPPGTCKLAAKEYVQNFEDLTCRRVLLETFINADARLAKKRRDLTVQSELSFLSRATIFRLMPSQSLESRIEDITTTSKRCSRPNGYKYNDAFCGAGGSARGAQEAGFKIHEACDSAPSACESFQRNFPSAWVCQCDISESFVWSTATCDHLHVSCPCQGFSPANTNGDPLDDTTRIPSLSVQELLKNNRPRTASFEQTSGLCRMKKHRLWFLTFIRSIAEAGEGYNVRYAVVDFTQYGLPSMRTRLVVFASMRGVPLPKFPEPTHGRSSHLLPLETTGSVLRSLAGLADLTLNDPNTPAHLVGKRRPNTGPYDAFDLAKRERCITTSGSRAHPSGTRHFTLRELASLNGFPSNHQFVGKSIQAQIGNAVPPVVWTKFMKMCIDSLRAFDDGRIDSDGKSLRSTPPKAKRVIIDIESDTSRSHKKHRLSADSQQDDDADLTLFSMRMTTRAHTLRSQGTGSSPIVLS